MQQGASDVRDPSRGLIIQEKLAAFNETSTAEHARTLDDDYPKTIAGLTDWHPLRTLAMHRPRVKRFYLHLVDQEPFDED